MLAKFCEDSTGEAQHENLVWAKRNLAMLAAMRGTADERRKATMMLTDLRADSTGNLDEMRSRVATASIAVRQLHGAERAAALQQAIGVLKQIVADKDGNAKDWHRLSQFQRMAGDRKACRDAIKEAMRLDEGNLFYVVSYVDDLLADGRLDEAQPFVAKLLQAPNDQRAVAAAARFYALSNLPARVNEVVDQYARMAEAGTADGPGAHPQFRRDA